jgi:hypothetical protein
MTDNIKDSTGTKSSYVKREVTASEKNPWANDLSMTISKGHKTVMMGKGNAIMDTSTGELTGQTSAMAVRKEVDREEFVKIFEGGIANIFELNKPSQDLFKVVLACYLDQKMVGDRIYINHAVLKEMGYNRSKQTYIQALNVLLNKSFLAEMKDMPGWLWVNPMMFFKGDRLRMIQEYAVKGSQSAINMRQEEEKIKQRTLALE